MDVLAVFVAGTKKPQDNSVVQALDEVLEGALAHAIRAESFKGETGSSLSMVANAQVKFNRVLLVGMGTGEVTRKRCLEFAVLAARAATDCASIGVAVPDMDEAGLEGVATGLMLGAYRYTRYLTGDRVPKQSLGKASVVVLGGAKPTKGLRDAVARGQAIGESANVARDLVNMPPNDLNAPALAVECQQACRGNGIQCKVYDKKAIERLGMPLFLAVNRGSHEEPRLVHMTYKPTGKKKVPKVVFVGKGLTFDSGGLCLKPPGAMMDMKMDMAGAAVTLGVVLAAARIGVPVEVHAIIASTDNMTGPDAYRPGDVFPTRKGMTVEIVNTDAEGRLVLADALAYASELGPDYIIDHATLTGACMVALGRFRAGLFANDDELRAAYATAADNIGENVWPLPLDEELREDLRSQIADIKHTGSRFGGTITAALFLKEFIGEDIKWAHMDIAGPAFLESNHRTLSKGATGFGVMTAVEFLRSL